MAQSSARTLIAPRAAQLRPSDIRLIMQQISDRGLTPLRLDIGEPDGPTPPHIMDAASGASRQLSRYAPALGTKLFRESAAQYLFREHGLEVSPDDIVATTGATGGLMTAFGLLCAPGDEVLVPTPGFPSYRTQIALAGAQPIGYRLDVDRGWAPDFDHLEQVIGPRTKVLVINSPGNPTGAVMDAVTIDRLLALAEKHDFAIISDEVYIDLALDGRAVSALSRDRNRVFSIFSLSKSFSMTGWRIGFCVVPPGLADALGAVSAQLTASVASVPQDAAVAAFTGPNDHLAARRAIYRERRDAVHAFLSAHDIGHTVPAGGFYQAFQLPEGSDSFQTALDLLRKGVAVVPGSAFTEPAGPFLRVCLTAPTETLLEGLELVRRHCW